MDRDRDGIGFFVVFCIVLGPWTDKSRGFCDRIRRKRAASRGEDSSYSLLTHTRTHELSLTHTHVSVHTHTPELTHTHKSSHTVTHSARTHTHTQELSLTNTHMHTQELTHT